MAVGSLVHASHEARQDYDKQREQDVPSGTFDYYPGNDDAKQIIHDLVTENEHKHTTDVVDSAQRTHGK